MSIKKTRGTEFVASIIFFNLHLDSAQSMRLRLLETKFAPLNMNFLMLDI